MNAAADLGYGAEGSASTVKQKIPKKKKGTKATCKFLRDIEHGLLQLNTIWDVTTVGSAAGQVLVAGAKGICQVTTEGKVTWREKKDNASGALRLSDGRVCVAHVSDVSMLVDGKWHAMLPGTFSYAHKLAQYDNHLLVLDVKLKKIFTLTCEVPSRIVREIDLQRAVGFTFSYGLCVLPSCGRIAVSDADTHQVALFDLDGTLVRLVGGSSGDRVTLEYPWGLCSYGDDHVIVAEYGGNRLSMFTSEGNFVSHLCKGLVDAPYSVCITPGGQLVCHEWRKSLKVFKNKLA